MNFLELKSDQELFVRIDPTDRWSTNTHKARYLSALHKAYEKCDDGPIKFHYQYQVGEMEQETRKRRAAEIASHGLISRIFRELNKWQELEYLKNGVYIGEFAPICSEVFTTEDGNTYSLDYFNELDGNDCYIDTYIEPLELSMVALHALISRRKGMKKYFMLAPVFALLTLLLLLASRSELLWDKAPMMALVSACLLIAAGLVTLCCLAIGLLSLFSDRKSSRQKIYDDFMKEAKARIPCLHRSLRFCALWGENQNRELPPKLVRARQTMEEAIAIYDQIVEGKPPAG